MAFIPLDRRFSPYEEGREINPDLWEILGEDGNYSWDRLLERRRVVVLAEAGSGKTTELRERAKLLNADAKSAFYATVQNVGRQGLEAALGKRHGQRLAEWREGDAKAWFLIDSVDEAKLDNVRLDAALEKIADDLAGDLHRAHIVLSGRHTDWEFRKDLARFADALPIPDIKAADSLTPDQRLEHFIRNRSRKLPKKEPEQPLAVVMAPLDAARIRRFAEGIGVVGLDAFMAGLEQHDLWAFARRPLDLEWMAKYWREHGRFGKLAAMVEEAIDQRLVETDPGRGVHAALTVERCRTALQRVGACFVLSRSDSVSIPDTEIVAMPARGALELGDMLPDWNEADQQRLARLPVFDPSTFGRARLHNDNEGVVRGFLAARWMRQMRDRGASSRAIRDLMFTESYGERVLRPSLRETAAWYALWDEETGNELIAREPFRLLNHGDPESLPLSVREKALGEFVAVLARGRSLPSFEFNSLRRFARPDLAEAIRRLWEAHEGHAEIEAFLLRLIWMGPIQACSDLAAGRALGANVGRRVALMAGRAFLATTDDAGKASYVRHILARRSTLPPAVVWEAIETLFPNHLRVEDLKMLLQETNIRDADGVGGVRERGADWVKRLTSLEEIEAMITAVKELMPLQVPEGDKWSQRHEPLLLPMLATAAQRLLEISPQRGAPMPAIEVAILLGDNARTRGHPDEEFAALTAQLHASTERRRAAFWYAADVLSQSRFASGPVRSVWSMEHLGWNPALAIEDLEWVLGDFPSRTQASDRALLADAGMTLWSQQQQPDLVLTRIEAVMGGDVDAKASLDSWRQPRVQTDEEREYHERNLERVAEQERGEDELVANWLEFAARLRADPDQLRSLPPRVGNTADRRIMRLWEVLFDLNDGPSHYAVDSTSALEPMFGQAVADAAAFAFKAWWRTCTPHVHSARELDQHHISYSFDSMGIAGIAMEAAASPDWWRSLTDDEVRLATEYATLELNGFPEYLKTLARERPQPVRDVLLREIIAQLDRPDSSPARTLDTAAWIGGDIAAILAEQLREQLFKRPDPTGDRLRSLLKVAVPPALSGDKEKVVDLLRERLVAAIEPFDRVQYACALLRLDVPQAIQAMNAFAEGLDPESGSVFLQTVLAKQFGGYGSDREPAFDLQWADLEPLIRAAYGAVNPKDDARHEGTYTPTLRDDAETARSQLVQRLYDVPSRATYEAFLRLDQDPSFPARAGRFAEIAREIAERDSEMTEWTSRAVLQFEDDFDPSPRTSMDLFQLVLRRLDDIQHALVASDFSQAPTLGLLPDETAIQGWLADRFRSAQAKAYSVEREPHSIGEKKVDIRIRSRATDVSVAIEVKDMNKDWSLKDLEAAVRDQLAGRYLRDRNHRHGILLLVHRQRRAVGWLAPDDVSWWAFEQVMEYLQRVADDLASSTPESPQIAIIAIDVA